MSKITIIDYGLGNIKSVQRAFEIFNPNVLVSSDYKEIIKSDKIVLPGVGTFGDGMSGLKKLNLVDTIHSLVSKKKPLLGICLGMQLMLDKSEEFGKHKGLGIINGQVIKIPVEIKEEKICRVVPHVGWNKINIKKKSSKILSHIKSEDYFYFVHSFMAVPSNEDDLLISCNYQNFEFAAGINKENIFGLQFHPEKSGEKGLKIIKNFIEL